MPSDENRFDSDRVGFGAAMVRIGLFIVVMGGRRIWNAWAQRHFRPAAL